MNPAAGTAVCLGALCGCVAALALCWLYCREGLRRVEDVAARVTSPRLGRHRAGSVSASERAVAWALQACAEFSAEQLGHPSYLSPEVADVAVVAIAQHEAGQVLAAALDAALQRAAAAEARLAEWQVIA